MALGGQHVMGFSPSGKLFALVDDLGVLRIWDTITNELKQEYTPNLHLSGPCTALTWYAVTHGKKSKKERKSIENTKQYLIIALGTSTGQVSLYDYALGKIERDLKGEGHSGKITSIVYNDAGILYTCGEDCQIIVWNLTDEKRVSAWSVGNEKPQSLAYIARSNNLIVGARQIKVYDVPNQELMQTFIGHTSEVNLLNYLFINDSTEYAISASKMERIICFWKIGKKSRNKSAACTLLMEDIALCLTCQVSEERYLKVASVTRSGVIHLYLIPIECIKSDKPLKPKVTISIASDSATVAQPIPALAASLQHSKRSHEILFGYGNKHFIIFEHLEPNLNEKMQVVVRADPKNMYSRKIGSKIEQVNLKILTPVIKTEDVNYKSALTVSKKNLKSIEMPMESRLQNLNLNASTGSIVIPQPQSKVQLLVQALHSKDATLLRSVLCTNDNKTIQLTLQKLPVQYVGILVNELTLLMQQKRMNVGFSISWLKMLAQTHSSQLLAFGSDDLLNKFGPCIGIIEHRANCLKELSKLSGRLQLLVNSIKRNIEDNLNSENTLVYEDADSSNSEFEDIAEKSASDDEWEDNDDEDIAEDEDNDIEEMET